MNEPLIISLDPPIVIETAPIYVGYDEDENPVFVQEDEIMS